MALDILSHYAALHHPDTHLPPDLYLLHDPHTLTIFDRFPKAKYHFLILPRIPFPVGDEDDDDEDKATETVPRNALASLHALLTTASRATALAVLHKLQQASLEVVEMVKDEMGKTDGFEWGIEVGFHAVPSMRHLHLHVISTDFISPSLKTKKHYTSFHPTLGFFLPLSSIISSLQASPGTTPGFDLARYATPNGPRQHWEPILKSPDGLRCCHCDQEYGNIPTLKRHLVDEWERMRSQVTSKG